MRWWGEVLDGGVGVSVRFEASFIESESFEMGRWRMIKGSLEVGDEVCMEVVVPA